MIKYKRFVVDTLQKTTTDVDAKKLIANVGKLEFIGTSYEALNRVLQANKLEQYNLKGMLRADYTFINNEM